jgi:hypothetical protein
MRKGKTWNGRKMERRAFIEKLIAALAFGSVFLVAGCRKEEKISRGGNQEKLWSLAAARDRDEEPLELPYAKETPAFYRDASLGKEDPSFKPQVGGG